MDTRLKNERNSTKLFISEKHQEGLYHWWLESSGRVLAEGICEKLKLDSSGVSYSTFDIDEWTDYIGK